MERLEVLYIDRERGVATATGAHSRTLRAGHHRNRVHLSVDVGDTPFLIALCPMSQPLHGALIEFQEALDNHSSVARTRQSQYHVGHPIDRVGQRKLNFCNETNHSKLDSQFADFTAEMEQYSP